MHKMAVDDIAATAEIGLLVNGAKFEMSMPVVVGSELAAVVSVLLVVMELLDVVAAGVVVEVVVVEFASHSAVKVVVQV